MRFYHKSQLRYLRYHGRSFDALVEFVVESKQRLQKLENDFNLVPKRIVTLTIGKHHKEQNQCKSPIENDAKCHQCDENVDEGRDNVEQN